MSYHHFTIDERERILIYRMQGLNAKLLHRHPSSISREWKRHLREYFPKGSDLTLVDEQTIQLWENKLNSRIGHENVLTEELLMKFSMKKMCT